MVRKPSQIRPRLEALLHERDHLRIKVSMAEDERGEEVVDWRRRILELDREITKHWDNRQPDSAQA